MPDPGFGLAQRFRDLVEARFRETRRISDYAGALGVSPTHLNRICRRVAGTTALGLIERRIGLEARAAGNHPFGAVLADADGNILMTEGNAFTTDKGPGHAETNLARRAAVTYDEAFLNACTLYSAFEPCAMCAQAIAHARVDRVVFGAEDPKSGGVLHGARVFAHPQTHHAPQVIDGIDAVACAALLRDFFAERRRRP